MKYKDLVINNVEFLSGLMVIEWNCSKGFGQLVLSKKKDGKYYVEDELMGEEFVEACLEKVKEYFINVYKEQENAD